MINTVINELLYYFKKNFEINDELDLIYLRNEVIHELNLKYFEEERIDESKIDEFTNPDYFTHELYKYIKEEIGINEDYLIDEKISKIYGILTPLPSVITSRFYKIKNEEGDQKALNYLYYSSIKNDYIKKSSIDRNLLWSTDYKDKNIEISINLSKPEKNNKDIAKLLTTTPSSVKYPACQLCKDNLGFYGTSSHPARSNIRFVPLNLNDEKWYLQYSPYGYFSMHSIVFKDTHSNMKINKKTFEDLLGFVDLFPSFFLGSNADLPIVGGSILNHEHYQGGKHILPVMLSNNKKEYTLPDYHSSKLFLLDWYNTCFLVEGKDKNDVIDVASKLLESWREYDDIKNNIISHTGETKHNTVTPSARKVGDTYRLYLILRNNRTSEEYPEGIFHAHPEYHHIKHEGIGIIEAMGLFILPARLKRQIEEIKDSLRRKLNPKEIVELYPDMTGEFLKMITKFKKGYDEDTIDEVIREYINDVCKNILIDTSVFKDDLKGRLGVDKFVGGIKF